MARGWDGVNMGNMSKGEIPTYWLERVALRCRPKRWDGGGPEGTPPHPARRAARRGLHGDLQAWLVLAWAGADWLEMKSVPPTPSEFLIIANKSHSIRKDRK